LLYLVLILVLTLISLYVIKTDGISKTPRKSIAGSAHKRRSSGGRSSNGESEVFDYDTGSEISEAEEHDTDEEVDLSTTMIRSSQGSRGGPSRGSSLGAGTNAGADNNDTEMDFDDGSYGGGNDDYGMDMGMDTGSPFSTGQSPLRRTSGGSASNKGGSTSKRRVSFGAGTKSPNTEKSTPKSRKGRSSNSTDLDSNIGTPETGAMTTPESTPGSIAISTPGSNDFPRGRKVVDESYMSYSDEDVHLNDKDDLVDSDDSDMGDDRDKSLIASARKKGMNYDDSEDEDDGRRSRRATKGKRFQYWKNERPVYDKGVIVGLLTAEPTPKKPKIGKSILAKRNGKSSSSSSRSKVHNGGDEEVLPVKLPTDREYETDETLSVWDDPNGAITSDKILSYNVNLPPPAPLPISGTRPKGRNGVGAAQQFFNIPSITDTMSGCLAGSLHLPARAIKDAEGVGDCVQMFSVAECQDGALEVGFSDPKDDEWNDETAQRRILSVGDSFYVPPGNIYRLENHSQTVNCVLYWFIVKPLDHK
jgi:hypothetical protein